MDSNEPLRSLSRRQEKKLLKAAADASRTDFASPDRQGCPDQRTLRLLARRDPSVEDSPELVDHIGTCSQCFVEYSRYRSRHKVSTGLVYAVPCLLLVAGIASWSLGSFSPRPLAPPVEQATQRPPEPALPPEISMVLNLRNSAVVRGDDSSSTQSPIPQLRRAKLALSMQLPVGSEEGPYEVNLTDSGGHAVRTAKGTAALQGFIQVLPIHVDLAELAPGTYILRVRRNEGAWRDFRVRVE